MTMADTCIECDVAIVGSGFAGALIANELSKTRRLKVVVLEAGPGVPPNINDYMRRFYKAAAKVPESPYPPELFGADGNLRDPAKMAAGRPTVLTLRTSNWQDPTQSYLIQQGPRPFTSTYERIAGGTSHWLGTSLRFAPADFRMKSIYGKNAEHFPCPDWPRDITYDNMSTFYQRAEAELGVSADAKEQAFAGITFPDGYAYPMPRIPGSVLDLRVDAALDHLTDDETRFLGTATPINKIRVRSLPAARNSQPYRNRRTCAGNTNCIPICPIQAKYDPTISLNDATSRNDGSNNFYTRIMPHTVASEVVIENDIVSRIDYIRYEGDTGPRSKGCVKAKVYVIAANAIETSRLLLMSRTRGTSNGVANSSGLVGRHLMDHPYYVAWGLLQQTADPVYPYRGPLITSGIGDLCDGPFRTERAAFRMDIGNEGWNFVVAGGQFGADPNVTALDFVNGTNAGGLNTKSVSGLTADNQAMFGVDLARKLNSLITRQFRIGFLVEQNPDPENRVTLSAEHRDALGLPRPQISYNISDYTRGGMIAAHRMKDLLFRKLGAIDFTAPADNDPARFEEMIDGKPVPLTYTGAGHIMGTCRMGDDAKTSVVDANQCSHDHHNLFLVGSSTFPTGATANPTLTLAALSMKTADEIVKRI
jgi:glucose dehydrogenase